MYLRFLCLNTHCTHNVQHNLELFNFIFTARKRSLGKGNIFTGICLSTAGSLYDFTSCLAAWSMFLLTGRSLCLVPYSFCGEGGSVQGSLPDRVAPGHRPPCTVKSGRYASYWNAFLFSCVKVHDEPLCMETPRYTVKLNEYRLRSNYAQNLVCRFSRFTKQT